MFSQNNKYYINEFEENVFDLQLPYTSIKMPFKR